MLLFVVARFTFGRATLTLPVVFVLARLAFTLRFALPFTLPFVFPLPFALALSFLLRGRLGLLSFALVFAFTFRLVVVSSSGVTVSDDSPAFVGRLMSIATVWPAFTTSPARGS